MRTLLNLLEGAHLLSGTLALFAILGMLAFFVYAVFARLSEERFQRTVTYLDKHLWLLGFATFVLFLLFAFLFYALTGR
jgi:hypothetical protein